MRSSIFFSAEAQNTFKSKGDSPPNHAPFAKCREMLEIFAWSHEMVVEDFCCGRTWKQMMFDLQPNTEVLIRVLYFLRY